MRKHKQVGMLAMHAYAMNEPHQSMALNVPAQQEPRRLDGGAQPAGTTCCTVLGGGASRDPAQRGSGTVSL